MKVEKDKIPDEILKEIFPKKLDKGPSSEQIYIHLKKMIISGRLKKGQKLVQEEIAQDFRVSRVTAAKAFTRLKKDGLIVSKKGVGSLVV
jgi:DNA-binding GntR family transcriptional regulator